MQKIVTVVTSIPKTKSKHDDDFCDRLSNRYTVIVLVVFAIVVSLHSYVGKPITCWAPKHFTGSHTKFTNSYCWVRNTYYLPWNERIPREDEPHDTIPYYQWVPFILLAQAVLFYMPSIFWHGLNQRSGMDADDILASANNLMVIKKLENRDKILKLISSQMDRFLASRKKGVPLQYDLSHVPSIICAPFGRRFTGYLVILFLLSKALYIGNVIGQLFILNRILATHYNIYGFEVLGNIVADHDWTEASHVAFPRVTLCDFNVRRLGNVHRYTVQCTLPINLYNEKIYMFLWFWMVFVALMSALSFITWLMRAVMHSDRLKFVRNHLPERIDLYSEKDRIKTQDFLDNYLRQDGAFLLRLIGHNTNNITVTDITCALWDSYNERLENGKQPPPDDDEDEDDDDDGNDESLELTKLKQGEHLA